ncbi:MAG: AIPR family protein [Oscillospiraceae bacterium]|nr:AIPR family protein [Oscillospiraceae bacterium]
MATLNEFRNSIMDDVHFNASMNGTSPREEFLALYADALTDAEEFDDFEQLSYEGVGPQNKRILIDGYFYDELEDCLAIVACPFSDSMEAESLTATDSEVHFRRARAFVEESLSGFIQKYAEESSPGYGLAIDIQKRYSNVSKYKFYLVTDMVMSSRIREIASTKIGNAVAEYHIWDIARLQALYASKTGKEDIIIDLTEFTEHGIPCLMAGSNGEYTAYLCNIPGAILAKLYNTYGGRLLEGNVRSFLTAKGKINKGIRNTILNEPEMFFAYNNGIAATAYDVKIEAGEICPLITEITSLQIVNGGQTTASLASALVNDKDRANGLKDIYVPMKLSVVTPEKAMELIPNIAKYANKQNKVSDADFFSNHAFHVRMEDFSRRILAPAVMGNQYGTHWYYERARGQYKQEQARMTKAEKDKFLLQNPKNQMFTKTDLAKLYNIFRQLPHQVSKGAQKNFIMFAEWASDAWEKDQTVFNERFFKQIVCLNILYKKLDQIVKYASWYEMGYKAQVVTYALSYLFYQIGRECPDRVLDFKSIWNQQKVTHETELLLGRIAEAMFNHLVSDDREVQNVTEWAKREACWKKAKEIVVPLGDQFIKELAYVSDDKDETKQAKKEQRQVNSASAMIQVAEYGVENWKSVLSWGITNRIFTPQDISFLKTAIAMESGKFPSEKQCARILQVLEKAREESYPR